MLLYLRKMEVIMSYILQTNHLSKRIDGKEVVEAVNIHIKSRLIKNHQLRFT